MIRSQETGAWLLYKLKPLPCFLIDTYVNLVSVYRSVNMYKFAFLRKNTLVKLVLELLKV